MDPGPTSTVFRQQDFHSVSQLNCSPTPIGPNATVEIGEVFPANFLHPAMDDNTKMFLKETFCGSQQNINREFLDLLVNLSDFSENDSVDKLPSVVQSDSSSFVSKNTSVWGNGSFSRSFNPIGGFNHQKDHWTERFDELVDFKKRFGHCVVPNNWIENIKLSQWVKRQRHQYKIKKEGKNASLSEERIATLEAIGFTWSVQEDTWEERFSELVDYKERFGHTSVPKNCLMHPQLSVWVKYQRRHLRLYITGERSSMTEERFCKLAKLGFQWNPRKEKKDGVMKERTEGTSSLAY